PESSQGVQGSRRKGVGSRIEVKRGLTPDAVDRAGGILALRVPGSNRTGARRDRMLKTYTAKYTRVTSGYMGQLVEWPEVITEGKSLDECRELLRDALGEMIAAYRQQDKEIPLGGGLIEQLPV